MLLLATWLRRGASSFFVCLPWLLLLLFFVDALLKTSSQEEHAKPSAELFELCFVSASQAQCLRIGDRAQLDKFSTRLGVLLLAALKMRKK